MEEPATNQNENTGGGDKNPLVLPARKFEEVTLKNDRKAKIYEGNGYDCEEAMRLSGTTDSADKAYMSALMSVVTEIDGKGVVMEDIRALGIGDYLTVMSTFTKLNF